MTDARKMAERALAEADRAVSAWGSNAILVSEKRLSTALGYLAAATRALLASEPASKRGPVADPADARRRAEEACRHLVASPQHVALWDAINEFRDAGNIIAREHAVVRVEEAVRGYVEALLAAGPEAKASGRDRIAELESLLRECNAVCLCGCPDSEHEADECGESCGHDDHECIRVAPAVLEIVRRYRVALSDALRAQPTPPPCAPDAPCDGTYACRCKRHYVASAPSPPSDAVREAETPGTNRVEGHDEQAPDTGRTGYEAKQRNVAGDEAPGQIPEVLGVQPTDGAQADSSTGGVSNSVQTLRSRAADGTVAPAGDAVREAAEELQRIDSLLARRITLDGLTRVQKIALALRVCEETDPKGEVAARAALRGGQKGGA